MNKIIVLMFAVLALVGCTQPVATTEDNAPVEVAPEPEAVPTVDRLHAAWTISDEFTADELESVLAAGDNWGTVTGGRVALTFTIGPVIVGDPWTVARSVIPGANGQTTILPDRTFIELDAETYEGATCVGQLWYVAAHEFGHSLGILKHGPDGVMQTGHDVASCESTFTQSDVDLFNEANP